MRRPADAMPGNGPWKIIDSCESHIHNTLWAARRTNGTRCTCPHAVAITRARGANEKARKLSRKANTEPARQTDYNTAYKAEYRAKRAEQLALEKDARERTESRSVVRRVREAPIPHFTGQEPCATVYGRRIFSAALDRPGTESHTQPAQELCAHCPLLAECRNWVMSAELEAGAWGGVYGGMAVKDRRAA